MQGWAECTALIPLSCLESVGYPPKARSFSAFLPFSVLSWSYKGSSRVLGWRIFGRSSLQEGEGAPEQGL